MLFERKINVESYRKVWFATDWHDNHDRDFIWGKRGFSSVEEHSRSLTNWRKENLTAQDLLIYHGDLCLNCDDSYVDEFFKEVPCQVYFIMGNHDQRVQKWIKTHKDELDQDFNVLSWKNKIFFFGSKQNFVFNGLGVKNKLSTHSHFPAKEWDKMNHGAWHVCGHVHGSLKELHNDDLRVKAVDPSYEVQGTWAIDFATLRNIMDKKQVTRFHHGDNSEVKSDIVYK